MSIQGRPRNERVALKVDGGLIPLCSTKKIMHLEATNQISSSCHIAMPQYERTLKIDS